MLFQTDGTKKENDSAALAGETLKAMKLEEVLKNIVNITDVITSNLDMSRAIADFNTMETAVTNLAMKFGGAREMADGIKQTINLATPSVIALGGAIGDVVAIQEGVIKALQTQTVLDKESYKDLYAIGNLVNDGTKTSKETTSALVKSFTDAGYSLYNISNQMTGVLGTAREIGVASAAVYKQLGDNMGKLNTFNFENGVQGMAKMAAQAAGLRIDMSKTLDFAEKVFNPEAAIQMSADFQRLGVQVTNLLDPYKLMDMARNDPEQLQKSIIEATKSLTYFDEKNQKMAILPGAQGQLRELAPLLGMSASELAKMATSSGDLERKMSQIRFSGEFASDEDKQMVAHMAQLGEKGTKFEGKYVVNLGTEDNPMLKAVDALDKNDKDRIKKLEGDKGKSAVELQLEANNKLTNISNYVDSLKGIAPRGIAASKTFNKVQEAAADFTLPMFKAAGNVMGVESKPGGYIDPTVANQKVTDAASSMFDTIKDVITGQKDASVGFTEMLNKGKTSLGDFISALQQVPAEAAKISKEGKERGEYKDEYNYEKLGKVIADAIKTNGIVPTAIANINPVTINPTSITSPQSLTNSTTTTQTTQPSTINTQQSVDVSGVIKHEFPSLLQPIADATLNNSDWMKKLQDMISKQVQDNMTLMGKTQ